MIKGILNGWRRKRLIKFLESNPDILRYIVERVEFEREHVYLPAYPKKDYAFRLLCDKLDTHRVKYDVESDEIFNILMDAIENAHARETHRKDSTYNMTPPPNVY